MQTALLLHSITAAALMLVLPRTSLAQESLVAVTVPSDTADVPAPDNVYNYEPLKGTERLKWALTNAASPRRLASYAFTAALGTAGHEPKEYSPHWDGFAKRMALRASTSTTSLFLEASIGALWDEDPRYVSATGQPLKSRILNIAKMTVMARNGRGQLVPAYARYISVPSSAFITRNWRPESQTSLSFTTTRIPLAFLDRFISNAFTEFWPDIRKKLPGKH